jgi:formamidopyrimidine-DNA glycosylase
MPELPEVETTVRGLERVLDGRHITRVEARREDLRRSFPKDLGQRLTGAKVTGLGRRAKYGLIHTDRGDTMIFHLGMSGSWRIDHSTLEKHDHLLLETDEGKRLALTAPRRSSCCCSISASLPGLATSMFARRCTAPESTRRGQGAHFRLID